MTFWGRGVLRFRYAAMRVLLLVAFANSSAFAESPLAVSNNFSREGLTRVSDYLRIDSVYGRAGQESSIRSRHLLYK